VGDPIKTFPRAYWYCKTVVSYPGSAATGAKMKHQRIILALLLLLVAASPMLVQGAQKALSRPAASTTTQASDNDDDDVRAGANHEANDIGHHDNESATGANHEENKTAAHVDDDNDNESVTGADHEENKTAEHVDDDNDNEDATDVDNAHSVNPSENVTITHCLDNSVVDLTIRIVVVPAEGANVTITHTVTPPSGHMFTPLTSAVEPSC